MGGQTTALLTFREPNTYGGGGGRAQTALILKPLP